MEHPSDAVGQKGHTKHPPYFLIWAVLAALTAAEIGVAFLQHWSKTAIVLVLIGLAVWKALLVALYFMHLKFERNRMRIIAIAPLPLAVILVLAVITEYIL